jgi:hypothetical protein
MVVKQEVRDRKVKNGVTEKFQPLVVGLLASGVNRTVRQRALKPTLISKCVVKKGLNFTVVLLSERLSNWTAILVRIVSALGGDLKDSKSHL